MNIGSPNMACRMLGANPLPKKNADLLSDLSTGKNFDEIWINVLVFVCEGNENWNVP